MKKFQRMKQQATEAFGRGDKSDKLTSKLAEVEKKVEGIRNGCNVTLKKLSGTILGSGSSVDKHQRKLPQYSLGANMMEAGSQLGDKTLFGSVLMMVGQAQQDIASQMAQYEISITHDISTELSTMLEEDMKKVDKSKKKLNGARLDMDSVRGKLKSFESQTEKATREYNMEKMISLKTEVDEATRKFEECQDTYATDMFDFLAKERIYTEKIEQLVMLQLTHYKNAAAQLEGMLPRIDKRMSNTQEQPMFGCPLEEHLRLFKTNIAVVLESCIKALRESGMTTEGLFRIAAGMARVKLLKSAFDAGQSDVTGHDPHTIAGCMKMYLRELPEPLLTFDLYPEWMQAAGVADSRERNEKLTKLIDKLPKANLENFKYLIAFLYEFAQYAEVTKMSVNNIAIVIGPNLLWPKVEALDAVGMVTDTALQRRISETFIENCHTFFPDLPETPPPNFPGGIGIKSSPYSPTSSSTQSFLPSSPKPSDSSSSSTENLPHPLADNAAMEGVTVHMDEGETSPYPRVPNPSPVTPHSRSTRIGSGSHSPPTVSKFGNTTPSPVPKPRINMYTRTLSGEQSDLSHIQISENGSPEISSSSGPARPVPPIKPRRQASTPSAMGGSTSPVPPKRPPPYASSGTLERKGTEKGRIPQRKAPPPPAARNKPPSMSITNNEELTSL